MGIGGGGGSSAHPLQPTPPPPTKSNKKVKKTQVIDEKASDPEPPLPKLTVLQPANQDSLTVAQAEKAKTKSSESKKGMILPLYNVYMLTGKYLTTCHI